MASIINDFRKNILGDRRFHEYLCGQGPQDDTEENSPDLSVCLEGTRLHNNESEKKYDSYKSKNK